MHGNRSAGLQFLDEEDEGKHNQDSDSQHFEVIHVSQHSGLLIDPGGNEPIRLARGFVGARTSPGKHLCSATEYCLERSAAGVDVSCEVDLM